MAHENYNVDGLSEYIANAKDLLIKNLLFGKGSRQRMTIQPGVKSREALHIFDVDPVFGDATDCGFDPTGSAALIDRMIEVAPLKVDMEICPKNLVSTFAEYTVATAATENPLPFEEYLFNGILDGINRKIEKLIWQGDTTGQDQELRWFDGILRLAGESVTASTGVIGVEIHEGEPALTRVMTVYNALPENVLERGAELYVSPATFRQVVNELVSANLFHYNPATPKDEVFIPGTDAKIVKVAGLAGFPDSNDSIIGTYAKNLVYGTDGENDEEIIDAWFSKDDRTWKVKVEWKSGVQIAFLDQVVLGYMPQV